MSEIIKSCKTCARREGFTEGWAKCNYSGVYCSTERRYPSVCGRNYENGWAPRPSIFRNIKNWWNSNT